jgi:formamidopyrimidine-DNA glycosylase
VTTAMPWVKMVIFNKLLAYGRAGEMCVNCETTLENLNLVNVPVYFVHNANRLKS